MHCIDAVYCYRCHTQHGSCVCMSVCVLGTRVSCAKTAEMIEMLFGSLTHVDPRNHVLHEGQDRMNPFSTASVAKCQCGLLPNYFGYSFYLAVGWRKIDQFNISWRQCCRLQCRSFIVLCDTFLAEWNFRQCQSTPLNVVFCCGYRTTFVSSIFI